MRFLADVRTYNGGVPPAGRLHVLGVDAQRVEPPVQLLLAHRPELAISDREADLLSRIAHASPSTPTPTGIRKAAP